MNATRRSLLTAAAAVVPAVFTSASVGAAQAAEKKRSVGSYG